MPETSALARLDRNGAATSSELARVEQISRQPWGRRRRAGARGQRLVARDPDARDGRRVVLSVTEACLQLLRDKRNARTEQLARALATGFTREELDQLMDGRAAARAPGAVHLMGGI